MKDNRKADEEKEAREAELQALRKVKRKDKISFEWKIAKKNKPFHKRYCEIFFCSLISIVKQYCYFLSIWTHILQRFYKIILTFKFIVKSVIDPEDNFWRNS